MARGRVSSEAIADLAVAPVNAERPEPPDELNAEEAAIWRAIVASRQAGWFMPEMLPMLRNLCAHIVASHVVEDQLRAFDEDLLKTKLGLEHYAGLSKVHALHTDMASKLATKMRLTPQARYDRFTTSTAAKRAAKETNPWSVERAA